MYLYFVFSSKTSILISDNTAHELCLLAAKSHSGCLRDSFGILQTTGSLFGKKDLNEKNPSTPMWDFFLHKTYLIRF